MTGSNGDFPILLILLAHSKRGENLLAIPDTRRFP